ncbi:MAG: EamA family transporter [Bacteroidetes bacterium]|jgi:drug/metabolite transporter (DMT)-like permease|nr:EamA family transporter [Bacteroidota bacterium]MDF1866471.1 EamA family transporter [Saprospiraceae bacterium]
MEIITSFYNRATFKMNPVSKAYLELHAAVLLFGFTAILGKLIELDATVLVWWRVFFTSISLLFLINVRRLFRELPLKTILQFIGIGILVGLHWVTFFAAIHLSNASICLVTMATGALFTSILEPFMMKKKVKWYEILLGLLVIPGLMLVVDSTEISMQMGIWMGLLSAILMSIFGILNKKLIHTTEPLNITFLEMGSAWIFLSILLPFYFGFDESLKFLPNWDDLIYLLLLSLVCTTLGYVLALRALKYISAFASNLTVNLEPVYGIILAIVILKENQELSANFYWGVLIVLGVIFIYPFLKNKFEKT